MDTIGEIERAKYEEVWTLPDYRIKAHGLELWTKRRDIFPAVVDSALDIGCGHGRLFAQWCNEGIDGHGVDFASTAPDQEVLEEWPGRFHLQCLWHLDLKHHFDLGVCADVMEHIPEERVDQTLERIAQHCDVTIFKVANFPCTWAGFDLHPTQRDADWWRRRLLSRSGTWVEMLPYDKPNNYLFLMRVR